jgi:hypothetical protein
MTKFPILLLIVLALGCKEKEVAPAEENELITTVKLTFTENGQTKVFKISDLDGDGGMPPIKEKILLEVNKSYILKVSFLNETATPVEDLNTEITAEADEHLVVISPNPRAIASYTYTDKDPNGLPIGLEGVFKTSNSGTGQLRLQLRHQPPVNGKNTKDGTATPGSDDVDLTFDLEIK